MTTERRRRGRNRIRTVVKYVRVTETEDERVALPSTMARRGWKTDLI